MRYLKDYLGPCGLLRGWKDNEYSNPGLLVRPTGSALSRSGKPWHRLPLSILSCLEGPKTLTTQNFLLRIRLSLMGAHRKCSRIV